MIGTPWEDTAIRQYTLSTAIKPRYDQEVKVANRESLVDALRKYVLAHPGMYVEAGRLDDVFARYLSGGLVLLTRTEREELRGIVVDRFFDIAR